jgi:predicted transcriptional regulator
VKNLRLGELELAVMDCVWKQGGPVTVPDVHGLLSKERKLAYTTTMTVMSRLHEKGMLGRREERRPYTYWAAIGREDYLADLMLGPLAEVGDRKAVLARFVERIGPSDAAVLADLVREGLASR